MNKSEIIKWDKPVFNNFIALPRIAKAELDPYEFKLYAHYIDETRWNRAYARGVRGTASDCGGIGKNKISDIRQSLQSKGYLTIIEGEGVDDPDSITLHADIWRRNSEMYDSQEAHFRNLIQFLEGGDLTSDQISELHERILAMEGSGVPDQGQILI